MNTKTLSVAALLLCGLGTRAENAPKPDKVFWGKVVQGVQAGVSLEEAAISTEGQHITFKLLLRNVGKKTVRFEAEGYVETPFNWSALTQERNRRVSITRMLNVNGRYPDPITVTLTPGETQVLPGPAAKFLLARRGSSAHTEPVVITPPGRYAFQVAPLMPRINGKDTWVQKLITGTLFLNVQASPASTTLP